MPPHKEQEYEQRRQQIIDGALVAFAAKGFEGASNRDIAEAAGIGSPGLIYHYFQDKADLLHQVLLERMPLIRLIDLASELMDRPPEELLPELAQRLATTFSDPTTSAIMRIVLVEAIRNPQISPMVNEIGPGCGLGILASYLGRQMDVGRLLPMDPEIAARLFVGPLLAHVIMRLIFVQPESEALSPDVMGRATAEMFLHRFATRLAE